MNGCTICHIFCIKFDKIHVISEAESENLDFQTKMARFEKDQSINCVADKHKKTSYNPH